MAKVGFFDSVIVPVGWFQIDASSSGWFDETLLDVSSGGSTQYTLTCQGGSYSLTNSSAVLSRNRLLVASGGSYNNTGQTSTIRHNRQLSAQGGSYSYTGQQVNITYTPAAIVYTLTCQGGTYTSSGQNAIVLKSKLLNASGGTYSLTGSNATISKNRTLVAQGGTYQYTGSVATIVYTSIYPNPSYVLKGITYGPGGIYTGTYDANRIKVNLSDGTLIKPLSDKMVITL